MTPTASPSLTLQALLKTAVSRGGLGAPVRRVAGLSAAAKALYVAAAAGSGRVLLLVPTDADVDQAVGDIRFFLAALEGLGHEDVHRSVLPFPSQEVDPYRPLAPHFEVAAARARALHALAAGTARIVVASVAATFPLVSSAERMRAASRVLRIGHEISPLDLGDLLTAGGYTRDDPVDEHGEYCIRGGVLDFFPAGEDQPIRLEFLGDTIESIRRYDPATQRSTAAVDQIAVAPLWEVFGPPGTEAPADSGEAWLRRRVETGQASLFDYLAQAGGFHTFLSETDAVADHGRQYEANVLASYEEARARQPGLPEPARLVLAWEDVAHALEGATALDELEIADDTEPEGPGRHIACQPALEFHGRVADWVQDVKRAREAGEITLFVAATSGRSDRVRELLAEYDLIATPLDGADATHAASVLISTGRLSRGFRLPDARLQLYSETDVFEEERRVHERRRSLARTFLSDFRDLKIGDLVVHVDHGIGRFVGLRKLQVGRDTPEFMELRYADEAKLFVPLERLDLVQKYTGSAAPSLDRLGGTTWERAKTRVRKAMRDMAGELLKLYAARKAMPGYAFGADTHWQQEFEDAFEYELTPDQDSAISDIKRDMQAPFPMDRLLCGDVGYGKTEVAMRAAFKAVMEGRQVAVLAPTTVLAFQHLKTLTERFAAFPVRIEMVSRFRSRAEQKAVLADLAAGKVEIIVGTHRLLSKDVEFRDLGLLVVDEEQRFGVAHKERIKQMRRRVDVLTMTATPIPRTLNMSLVGIRDMSVIETPPKDRLSIQTAVVKFDQAVIARAIRNELERGGQVYFVHNRVESIYSIGNLVARLVPDARLAVAHGQMGEAELERVMVDFVARKHDVLVATTIIENGLDIPNANTIIVNRADRYGLAQLYQLRGRVGRSDRRAYAYLLIPPESSLSPVARKRLAAIREFSDLGSGFRIAALDLEIRGAGNLLGGEQSGHIEAIGFEMYMKLLEQTVRELKGEELEDERHATLNLHVDLRIDESYIPDMNQRLGVYRRIAGARSEHEIEQELEEVRDRYGAPPDSMLNLYEYGRLRVLADELGVESLDRQGSVVTVKFRPDATVDPARLLGLVAERPDLTLHPPVTLLLDLAVSPQQPRRDTRRAAGRARPEGSGSWWTARATAGQVTPGFSRDELTRPAAEDPRAPGGLFARTGALLADLRRKRP